MTTLAWLALLLVAGTAQATTYTFTKTTAATYPWTTTGNWDANGVPVSATTAGVTFFSDTTTALGNGTITISSDPATLTLNTLTINGLGAAATGNSTVSIGTAGNAWTFDGTTPTINLNGLDGTKLLVPTVKPNITLNQSLTISGAGTANAASGTGFTFSGVIGGANGITLNGTSTVTFSSGSSTFSGQLTVASGTLNIGGNWNSTSANGPLGNSALAVILGSSGQTGTLRTSQNGNPTKPLTFAAGGTGVLYLTGGGNYIGTFNGSGNFTKMGTGTMAFNCDGSGFSGVLTVGQGTFRCNGSATSLGAGTFAMNDSTTLDVTQGGGYNLGRNTTINGNATISLSGGASSSLTLGTLSIGAYTLSVTSGTTTTGPVGLTFGATTLANNATFAVTNPSTSGTTTLTLGAVGESSPGGYGLTKTGNGMLVLSGANAYTGATTLSGGTLQFNNSTFGGAAGSVTPAASTTVAAGYAIDNTFLGRLPANSTAYTVALAANSGNNLDFSGSAGGVNLPNVSLGAVGAATYSGTTLTPNGTTYRLGGGGGTLTVSSALVGAGYSLVISGPGTVILSGNNTFDGTTTVSAGNLQYNSAAAIGNTSSINLPSGATIAAGYDAGQAFLAKLAGTSTAFTFALGANDTQNLDFSAGTGANLALASLGALGSYTYSGTITPYGGTYRLGGGGGTLSISTSILNGNNALVVSGPGTVTLASPANTFTGNVTVSSATLNVNSAGAFNNIARTVTVNSGATVNFGAANAASADAITVNSGGTVSPTVANALNGSTLTVNTGGQVTTPLGTANAYTGSTISLNGGTVVFGRSAGAITAGGNYLVQAISTLDSYQANSAGTYNDIVTYGTLDFAADGLTLNISDAGLSASFGPAGTRSQFNGSIISHSDTVNMAVTYAGDPHGLPTFELNNTAIRAGKTLTVTQSGTRGAAASLIGTLGVATLGGAEVMTNTAFTMYKASTLTGYSPTPGFNDASAFDTTGGLWSKSGTTTLTATLGTAAGSLGYGQSASFNSASAGYVSLTGLTVGNTYPLTLTLAGGNTATVAAQLAKNPAFTGVMAYGANQVTMQFTAQAATTYFVWDNVHTSLANWYLGDNLTAVYMGPTLTASATLTPFVTTTGTASSAQSFPVTAINLTASVTCTAPAGFEVSTDGSSYAGSVNFTPAGVDNSVSGTLYIRIAAATAPGSYSGSVQLSSTGVPTINIAAVGVVYSVGGSPVLTGIGGLTNFISNLGLPSPAQSVFVSGAHLTANITCTAPSGYEVSTDGSTYAGAVNIVQSGGLAAGNLYIRLAATTPVGPHNGNVVLSSSGATSVNVAVTGAVYGTPTITASATLTPFTTTYGTASAAQNFPVSGSSLTVNLACSVPAGFEVSTDGSTYAGAASFTPSGGSVSGTLYVRLAATTAIGSYSGSVALTSGAATPVNISATGTVSLATGDGIWAVNASGVWSIPTDWENNQAADGQGKTAWFTNDITSGRTITMDSARTLGSLNVGDANGSAAFTITNSGGATLTFDNGVANAQFNQVATSKGDLSTVPVLLNGSLDLANASANPLTINAAVTANSAGGKTLSNLGTGAGAVTLGGVIADGAGTVAVVQNSGTSTLILTNAANAYSGGTTALVGTVQFQSAGAIGGSGRNVTAASGAAVAAGYALDNAFLNRVAENNHAFTVALGANSGNDLDFSTSAGANLPSASLGAVGAYTYTGTLTPNGTTYRLGGGGGTLTFNPNLTGGNSLAVSGSGTVVLNSAANTFSGDVTITSGTLKLNTAGAFNNITRNVTVNPGQLTAFDVPNALGGCTIYLNGGTNRFGRDTTGNPYTAGGNFVVQANSQFDSYNSSVGNGGLINQYGSLDFAAADPLAYPNGYQLKITDTGVSYNYGPSGVISRFVGSTIGHSGAIQFATIAYTGADAGGLGTLEFNNTSVRAGMTLTVTTVVYGGGTTAAKLTGTLGVTLLGGAELLNNNTSTLFQFPTSVMTLNDTSTFDTTGGLWSETPGTTITATLASPVGSISDGGSATFAATSAGNVSLTGLTIGNAYPLTLTLANSANQATVLAQLAKNPAFSHIAAAGASQVTLQFTAPAETTYFAWDNLHTSAANWYLGGDLTGVLLGTQSATQPATMTIGSDGAGNFWVGGTTSTALAGQTLHLYISHDLGLGMAGFILVPGADGTATIQSDGTYQFWPARNPAADGTPTFYLVK